VSLYTSALFGLARPAPGWVLDAEQHAAAAGVRAARSTEQSTRRAGLNVRRPASGITPVSGPDAQMTSAVP
jgi:hypothetical protein